MNLTGPSILPFVWICLNTFFFLHRAMLIDHTDGGETVKLVDLSALTGTRFDSRVGTNHVLPHEYGAFDEISFHESARILSNTNQLVAGEVHKDYPFSVTTVLIKGQKYHPIK